VSPARVSAITIFLDAESFLEEAVQSIRDQTFQDWELFLVDDGSRDRSREIARDLVSRDPGRIHYVTHPDGRNRGMSAARNLGLQHARGDYVAFLDSDDVWLPGKLAEQVALLDALPEVGMLAGATEYWRSWTGAPEDADRDQIVQVGEPLELPFDSTLLPPELVTLLYPLAEGASPSTSNLIARREVFEQVGGFEGRFRGLYEDQAFLAKAFMTVPTLLSRRCWDRYRQHPDSCVARVTKAGHYEELRRDFLFWFEGHLRRSGVSDPRIWKAWRRASRRYRHPTAFSAGQLAVGWARPGLRRLLGDSMYFRLRFLARRARIFP